MSTRVVYLLSFRQSARQRAHFGIWVPYANGKDGTFINVVGAPMAGFQLEFKRGYDPSATAQKHESFQIGQIHSHHVHDWAGEKSIDSTPRSNLETVASEIPPPRKSENFMAPVNETTNRRCQEWTMDFVQRLVSLQYLDNSAIDIVQSKRDSPTHGIMGLQGEAAASAPEK
ncbi:hypothetical protein DM02DRAFT_714171 [Periconia macrospinosa]|uniref:Uncharacterized protein n=1 Tax=Periconia macrospinosa TaxID=97972 RepID=A0A2V1EDU0_9PLEO|nr:hypothetical protein DM02DRAFT_714171 [Periconia macrospinosa]